jgi:hypothetical protein
MRTNKTITCVVGISAALVLAAGVCFAVAVSSPTMEVKPAVKPLAVAATAVVAPKFEAFDPAKYTGKTGKITLPYAGTSMLLMRKFENGKLGDYMQVMGKEKTIVVPVGTYKVATLSMTTKDKDGKQWSILCSPVSDDKARALDIKAGATIVLPACEPITASIDVKQNADKVTMSLQMLGAGGDKCTIQQMAQAGTAPEAPGFQVLSKSGKVLMSGKFQYG